MASTAPKIAEAEQFDSPAVFASKVAKLVALMRKSKHFIVFTGAGISTSAGIADFRGPRGVWTLRAQGKGDEIASVNTLQAIPTRAHMALVALQKNQGGDASIMKHLVSQNCDGLHRRSGILPENISELHGNSNREYCANTTTCGKEYLRDFRATATYERSVHDHRTGRKCILCGGALLDTIINFGESLPEKPLEDARRHANEADLLLVLGSSLTVSPANGIPEIVGRKKGAKLVICNLQSTPIDGLADLRISAKADDLMVAVMEGLGLGIPPFILRRKLAVEVKSQDDERHSVTLRGVDADGTPVTFLRSLKMEGNRRVVKAEPFTINFRGSLEGGTELKLELEFMGHYNEPNLAISHVAEGGEVGRDCFYELAYDPSNGEWVVEKV